MYRLLIVVPVLLSLFVAAQAGSPAAPPPSGHHHARAPRPVVTRHASVSDAALQYTHAFPPPLLRGSSRDDNYTHCGACCALTSYVVPLLQNGWSMDAIEVAAIGVCMKEEDGSECSGIVDCYKLCKGIIGEYAAIIVDIASNTTLAPQEICFDIGLCPVPPPPGPPIAGVPVPSNVSDMTGQKRWPMWGSKGSGTFLHLSDLHFDTLYQRSTDARCGLPLCCRAEDGSGDAGMFGAYKCDSPELLLLTLFDYLNTSLTPRPDFILYTGDDPAHDVWQQTFGTNLAAISYVSSLLLRYFPDVPVFSAVGNHEACPVNLFGGPGKDTWLYRELVVDWSYYLPDQAQRTLNYGGYYATLVRPGLYVLSINSNIYATGDSYVDPNDPQDLSAQLPWLNNSLYQIEQLQGKAIIIGHVPTGNQWYDAFNSHFAALLDRYNATILNLFWGHTHNNEVQLYHSTASSVPHTVGYIGGSVTPYEDVNPGFAVYSYDRGLSSSYLVSDVAYHWINLTDANVRGEADWAPVHISAIADYALPSLSPRSWYKLAESLRLNGSADVYDSMRQAYSKGLWTGGQGSSDERRRFACEVENVNDADARRCERGVGVMPAARRAGRDYEHLLMDCSGKGWLARETVRAKWLQLVHDSKQQLPAAAAAAAAAE